MNAFQDRDRRRLGGAPKTRVGTDELDADAGLAVRPASDVYDAAFLFGLIDSVGKKQALAGGDDGFQGDEAAAFVDVNRGGFLVKGLLFGIGAVDQQGHLM